MSPRKSIEKVLTRLKEVLRTSPGRHLEDAPGKRPEDVSWKTSWGRLLEDVLTTSLKKIVTTSISDQSKMSLRPKLRCFYDVFATSLCRLGYRCLQFYKDHLLQNFFKKVSLEGAVFSEKLKIAKVILVFKNGIKKMLKTTDQFPFLKFSPKCLNVLCIIVCMSISWITISLRKIHLVFT